MWRGGEEGHHLVICGRIEPLCIWRFGYSVLQVRRSIQERNPLFFLKDTRFLPIGIKSLTLEQWVGQMGGFRSYLGSSRMKQPILDILEEMRTKIVGVRRELMEE